MGHSYRTRKARELSLRLAEIEIDLERATQVVNSADATKAHAVDRRVARRAECEAAREAYNRAARGVADWQAGLEELHRNAHAHRLAQGLLARAREVAPELTISGIDDALESLRLRARELDRERARIETEARSASIQRDEYDRARAALVEIVGPVEPGREHERAREVLTRALELKSRAEELEFSPTNVRMPSGSRRVRQEHEHAQRTFC